MSIELRQLDLPRLAISSFIYALEKKGVRLGSGSAAELRALKLEHLRLGDPLDLRGQAAGLELPALEADFAGQSVKGDLGATSLRFEIDQQSWLEAKTLALAQARFTSRAIKARVAQILASNVRFEVAESFALASASLEASGLSLQLGKMSIALERFALPSGFSLMRPRMLQIPRLRAQGLELAVDIPVAEGAATEAKESPADGEETSVRELLAASGVLDQLEGQIDFDLEVDATLPVFGERKAIHRFRLPVSGGAINFRTLEAGLAGLEEAALDFELEEESLILEKDLPLIPFDNSTLVRWPLDQRGLALARADRVALSTLLKGQLEISESKGNKSKSLALHRVAAVGIAVALSSPRQAALTLPGLGRVQLGGEDAPALAGVRIQGAMIHRAEGSETAELNVTLDPQRASVPQLQLGQLVLSAGALDFGPCSATISFTDLTPTRLRLSIDEIEIDQLRLSW